MRNVGSSTWVNGRGSTLFSIADRFADMNFQAGHRDNLACGYFLRIDAVQTFINKDRRQFAGDFVAIPVQVIVWFARTVPL